MDKEDLYNDLVDLGGHIVALYFVLSDPHHLSQLTGNMDIHLWTDYSRAGKDDDGNLITDFLDELQEAVAIPLLEDGYIGSKDILARAVALTPDVEQDNKNIGKVMTDTVAFISKVGNRISEFDKKWIDEIRKEAGYKADAYQNLLNTWCQNLSQRYGWLIGYGEK